MGVSPSAPDEQTKNAYRELARKYHPDNYANNPLADLAQEKMKEINEAYDQIQRQRKQQSSRAGQGYSQGGYSQSGYSQSGYSRGHAGQGGRSRGGGQFARIRQLLIATRGCGAEGLPEGVEVGSIQRAGEDVRCTLTSEEASQLITWNYRDPEGGEHRLESMGVSAYDSEERGGEEVRETMFTLQDYPWDEVELELRISRTSRLEAPLEVPLT